MIYNTPNIMYLRGCAANLAHGQLRSARSPKALPYPAVQVLGIPPDADSARIEKAYRTKRREAEIAGDREALKKLEDAHNSVFMAALNTRLAVLP